MNILVTGDSGFLGSFLMKRLNELGHQVEGLNTRTCNIFNYECIRKVVKDRDIVFHLAGPSDPVKLENDNNYAYNMIYRGTENISIACRNNNAKLVFTSSRFVYGEPVIFPTSEDSPLVPLCWYGTYKMLAEYLCLHGDFIIRLSNVYGPSPKSHSVVTKFIKLVRESKTIPVFNNLNVLRDFVYVDDVIDALLLGLDKTGIYNVGGGTETSLKALLDKISGVFGLKYNTIDMKQSIHPFRDDKVEMQRVWLDITKIKNDLGWEPKITLEEGIRRCKDV